LIFGILDLNLSMYIILKVETKFCVTIFKPDEDLYHNLPRWEWNYASKQRTPICQLLSSKPSLVISSSILEFITNDPQFKMQWNHLSKKEGEV